ncbi:MAG: glutathionylspermidine synthase family protein [Peptococcaceae bacterium]|nr:glutathionylspermidine synthase family protein [Peptococcaceae bacterium]
MRISVLEDDVTTIGRFDFAQTKEGIKILEFNADTPTSIVEVFSVNQSVCDFFNRINPNKGLAEQLKDAFAKVVNKYKELGYKTDSIVFSSLDWHEEDKGTTLYLMQQSGLNAKFVALEDLRLYSDNLCYLENGEYKQIDVWFRLHALEMLAKEKDEDGFETGAHILNLVAKRKLALINAPSAFIAQTKAMQALIWGLHEENEFFTQEEHETIEKYMLPTYMDNKFEGKCNYVTKPFYGREGGAVSLYASNGEIIAKDEEEYYWDQPCIYQRMVELEELQAETINGPYKGRSLWESFLIGGKASGIGLRVGDLITGNLSFFLPICVEDNKGNVR